jgi:methylase of polypeptide subunit release factors
MGKESCYSIFELADILVKETTELLPKVKNEEELKINFEKLLEPIKNNLKIKSSVQYNRTILTGRPDAVHGGVIIEYEPPKSFSSKRKIEEAYNQLVEKYLPSESKKLKPSRLVGVGFDGEKIFFVKYRQDKWIKEPKEGAYPFNVESAKTFLIYLRGLSRLPLTAENLAQKFGSQSELAQRAVSAFINSLRHWSNERSQTFFDEWKRLFGIVYGEKFAGGYQEKEREAFLKLYKVDSETNFQELLFSLHTYFAFLMKLIAAEILSLRETSFSSSFSSHLVHIPNDDQLKRELEDIENGGIYARKGITNFLEGDFFCWYLSAFDSPELKDAIREIARGLSEFEPATSILDPDAMHDLLKKLYQHLVPKDIRHQLGEYYTPDWLAELLLDEVGYDGNTLKKLLDPACGSGTFLVLAIQRAIQHGREKEKIPDIEIAKRIITNIWGFDLNPLAVIAARTNYLFVLGDLVNEILDKGGKIEIPIYLCDSILTPTRTEKNLFSEFLEVSTSVGRFQIPAVWVKESYMLRQAAPLIEEMVKNRYSVDEAMMRLEKEGLVFSHNKEIVENFYQQILKLEKEKKNGIWARFLKNAFAPMIAGKFDFVVGNPPWIRWDYLSQEYRNATLKLWKDYGLFSLKGFQARLGGGKKDFSMLFVYASADYYLKDGAKLGFLITQEVFKSKGAGEGFRRFQLGEGKYLKVLKAHDLVSIQPFEGATNKTAAIILKKGEKTQYPVPYIVWTKKKGVGKIATDKLLGEVLPLLQKKKYIAKPIGSNVGAWQTQPAKLEILSGIEGKNSYEAKSGIIADPYGVFWVQIIKTLSDGNVIINNLPEEGKRKISKIKEKVEANLIYPSLRGSDIQRWQAQPKFFVFLTQDPHKREPISEDKFKNNFPRTYSYFTRFKEVLLSSSSKTVKRLREQKAFYAMFGVGDYTLSKYKVVWKQMSNDIYGAVISQIKTSIGYKTIIPLHTTAFIATNNETEAHYLCAIINSKPVRDFVKSFSSAGRGFGTPSVMKHVAIPKFDPENPLHQKLAEISKKCHALQAQIYQLEKDKKNNKKAKELKNKLAKLEKENDRLVKELFNKKED